MTRQHAVKMFTFALMIPCVACGPGRESTGRQSDSGFAAMQALRATSEPASSRRPQKDQRVRPEKRILELTDCQTTRTDVG